VLDRVDEIVPPEALPNAVVANYDARELAAAERAAA
jgi:hypothetical protein